MKLKNLTHLHISFSEYAAKKMVNLNITPNQLSWLSLISVSVSAILFSFGNYFYSIFGVLFFHFSLLLNRLDGALARVKKMSTFYGKWVNDVFDEVRYPVVITGLIIGASNPTLGIVGCIGITSYLYHRIVLDYGKASLSEAPTKSLHLFGEIFGKVLRYSIVILALLNSVQFFVLIFASYALIYCLVAFYIYDTTIRRIGILKTEKRRLKKSKVKKRIKY